MQNRRRIAATQPYVAPYRVPLWSAVRKRLDDANCDFRVFWGAPRSQLESAQARRDIVRPLWAEQVPVLSIPTPKSVPTPRWHRLPREWRHPDVLLTEMQVSNLNAWTAPVLGVRIVTFGHGNSDTTSSGRLATALENYLNRTATRVLTYTDEGRAAVVRSAQIPPEKVTAFRNATDTTALSSALAEARNTNGAKRFRETHRISPAAKLLLYIGSLEQYKRIDILDGAFRSLIAQGGEWHLVVAGAGPERGRLEKLAIATQRVTLLGRVGPETYASAAIDSAVIVNPGRVGLLAVDALTMGLPIITLASSSHAPEYSYLRPDTDVIAVRDDPAAIARAIKHITTRREASAPEFIPSIDHTAEAIADTLLAALPH